jgi:hypothetical protein
LDNLEVNSLFHAPTKASRESMKEVAQRQVFDEF